jgi:hypothetical protein
MDLFNESSVLAAALGVTQVLRILGNIFTTQVGLRL